MQRHGIDQPPKATRAPPGSAPDSAADAVERAWRLQFTSLTQACEAADQAIVLARAERDRHALAHGCFQSAYVTIRSGQPAAAQALIQKALKLFNELDDQRGVWLACALSALQIRSGGDTAAAIDALLLLDASPPATVMARDRFVVDMALALSYRFVGDLAPALKWHYRAVASARDSGEPQLIGAALCNLGGYHADVHNPDEACSLLEEALGWAVSGHADRTVVIIAIHLTQSLAARGLHEQALSVADGYLRPIDPADPADASALLTLALAYANAGRAGAAVEVLAQALSGQNTPPDQTTPQVFRAYVEARVALAAGQAANAVTIGLALFDTVNESAVDSPADLMHLHATVAEAYEALGDAFAALLHERRRAAVR